MKSKLNITLLIIPLFANIFFSGYNVIMGKKYAGADVDNTFVNFMMLVDTIPLILFIRYLGSRYSKNGVGGILFMIFIILLLMLVEGDINYPVVKAFIAYTIPSVLIGIIFAKIYASDYFAKLLEPLMLFLTLTGTISLQHIVSTETRFDVQDEFGIGMQSLSYYTAFAFALNLYYILFGDEMKDRFAFTRIPAYRIFTMVLLLVQVIVTLSSGGRGGFVLLAFSSIILISIKLQRHGSSRLNTALTLLLMTAIALIGIRYMPENVSEAIGSGSQRTFSYISREGIDMSETSNRDIVYGDAVKDIERSPIIGYGILMKGTFIEGSWPHNIFLEVLLQGGVLYLIVFLIVVSYIIRKLIKMIKNGHKLFIIPIALYPTVMLFFSGSYMSSGLFWFSAAYILCYEIHPQATAQITYQGNGKNYRYY